MIVEKRWRKRIATYRDGSRRGSTGRRHLNRSRATPRGAEGRPSGEILFVDFQIGAIREKRVQGRVASSSRHADGLSGRGLPLSLALVVRKREELVLDDGAAEVTAIAIEVVTRVEVARKSVGRVRDPLRGGDRVEIAILEVLVKATMNGVGPRLDEGVELAAGGVPVLRGVDVLKKNELTYSVVGDIQKGTRDGLAVVVNAIQQEIVVAGTLATDGRADAGANAAGTRRTGREQSEIDDSQADGGGGQVFGFLQGKRRADLRGGGVDGDVGLAGHFNRAGASAYCEGDVLCLGVVRVDGETLDQAGAEAVLLRLDVIQAVRKLANAILAAAVGLAGVDDPGSLVDDLHGNVRDHGPGAVANYAD